MQHVECRFFAGAVLRARRRREEGRCGVTDHDYLVDPYDGLERKEDENGHVKTVVRGGRLGRTRRHATRTINKAEARGTRGSL